MQSDFCCLYAPSAVGKEGISLIKHEYKKQGLNFKSVSSEAMTELLKATDGSPLAIKWAVGQISTNGIPIERIITLLQTGRGDVFEKMFSSSWRSLDEVSQSVLYKLLFFTPIATREALYYITELDEYSFEISISKLCRLSLLEVSGENVNTQSYGFHPLTRAFVESRKEDDNIDDESFYKSAVDYYVRFCREYGEIGTTDAFDKLEDELSNIYKVINWAKQFPVYSESLILIVSSISVFLWSRGYWIKRVEFSNLAVEFALSCGNTKQAIIHEYYVGIVKFWQGDLEKSAQSVAKCRELNSNINDSICNALILRLEALIHMADDSELSINNFIVSSVGDGIVYTSSTAPSELPEYYPVSDFYLRNYHTIEECTDYKLVDINVCEAEAYRTIYGYASCNCGNDLFTTENYSFHMSFWKMISMKQSSWQRIISTARNSN